MLGTARQGGMQVLERKTLMEAKRIVVKVGTSTLTHNTGKPNLFRIEQLAMELADLANQGKEIILVSSGAVGAGMDRLGLQERPKTIPEKQAAAAVGQGLLMHVYEKAFSEYGQVVAQVLLTREDSVNRSRYANSRNTLLTLLAYGVIPIVNENDAVAIEELKIGDNDTLSAMVANIVDADLLIILSDIDGVYTANPQTDLKRRLFMSLPILRRTSRRRPGAREALAAQAGCIRKYRRPKWLSIQGLPWLLPQALKRALFRAFYMDKILVLCFYRGKIAFTSVNAGWPLARASKDLSRSTKAANMRLSNMAPAF